MSNPTTYYTVGGVDLSNIFQPLSLGTAYPSATGYKIPDGKDLNEIFAAKISLSNWSCITSSSNGSILLATIYGGNIYKSIDSGLNWTILTSAGSNNWKSIASSSTGQYLCAVAYDEYIYTSTNSGVTFNKFFNYGIRKWTCVIISDTGYDIFVVSYDGYIGRIIYDTELSAYSINIINNYDCSFNSIKLSTTNSKLAVTSYNGQIWLSYNYGFEWTPQKITKNWKYITSSNNGSNFFAVAENDYIYKINNTSTTIWTTRDTYTTNFRSVASLGNGRLAAVVYGGSVWTSSNLGITWTQQNNSIKNWSEITVSGQTLLACVYNGKIWTSSDYGSSWDNNNDSPTSYWVSISSNYYSSTIVAAQDYATGQGYIYMSTNKGSTWNKITSVTQLWKNTSLSAYSSTQMAAFDYTGYIHVYNGITFIAKTNSGLKLWRGISRVQDTIVACEYSTTSTTTSGNIYISYNAGDTWNTINTSNIKWKGVLLSWNLQYIYAITEDSYIYMSTTPFSTWTLITDAGIGYWKFITRAPVILDNNENIIAVGLSGRVSLKTYQMNFTQQTSQTNNWTAISSIDDTNFIATADNDYIYKTNNSGDTWNNISNIGPKNWSSITTLNNGSTIIATSNDGIYCSYDSGITWNEAFSGQITGLKVNNLDLNTIFLKKS